MQAACCNGITYRGSCLRPNGAPHESYDCRRSRQSDKKRAPSGNVRLCTDVVVVTASYVVGCRFFFGQFVVVHNAMLSQLLWVVNPRFVATVAFEREIRPLEPCLGKDCRRIDKQFPHQIRKCLILKEA
jgi:hypothetical protein